MQTYVVAAALLLLAGAASAQTVPFQLVPGAIEENGGHAHVVARFQLLHSFDDLVGHESARAAIEADRQRLIAPVGADEAAEEADREIVDGLPPQILEFAQRGALAGSQHAGHQQDSLPRLL